MLEHSAMSSSGVFFGGDGWQVDLQRKLLEEILGGAERQQRLLDDRVRFGL
jgi:hypothetical protein